VHRPNLLEQRAVGKDTKTLNYSAKLVPFLKTEIERISFELPADAPSFGAASAVIPDASNQP
jgi:hypothetical protein